jgi:PAS domain S-box-containing protein
MRRRKTPALKHRRTVKITRGPTPSASKEELRFALLRRKLSEARQHRRRAEQALRESEYKRRQMIESAFPGMLWVTGPDGEVTHVNQRTLDFTGARSVEDLLNLGWEKFLHPEDFPKTANAFFHAIQTGESYENLQRVRRVDGEYRWHHVRAKPLRDRKGHIIEWYGLSVDIDDGKKIEERLRRNEAYLAEAQRISHTGSWAFDLATRRLIYWSEECYRIWGFDPVQGLPDPQIARLRIHPDDRDRVDANAREARRQKKGYTIEFRIVLPDGTVKYLECREHHLLSASGELVEAIGTDVDVTERKCAEQALRGSEHKFRRLVETLPSLIWATTPDGEPSQLNQRVLDYSGMRFEDFLNGGWERFIHPDDLAETANALNRAIKTGTSYETVHRLRRADGEYRWHHAIGEPLRDDDGRITQWYGLAIDVDDAKKAEERARDERDKLQQLQSDLAHMNRLSVMGELAASLAHEIAQPVAAARNYARAALNFLDQHPPKLSEVRKQLDRVVDAGDRSREIIERIRDHIKKAPPRMARFDLNRAIDEVIELGRGAITRNGVSVRTHLAQGLRAVEGDRVQLQQVVLNLILNAIEAMGSVEAGTRELSISTEQKPAGGVLIAVCDTGPGVDSEQLERVFDAFYTTKTSGTGMGLSISRSIIDAHGGRLWAGANEPRGAVFQFILPDSEKEIMAPRRAVPNRKERREGST